MKTRLIQFGVVLAVLAATAFAALPHSSVARAAFPSPLYVECSTTVWQQVVSPGEDYEAGIVIDVSLQALKDARDFQYCGQVRARMQYNISVGTWTMRLRVWQQGSPDSVKTSATHTSGPTVGAQNFYTGGFATTGGKCYYAEGDDSSFADASSLGAYCP